MAYTLTYTDEAVDDLNRLDKATGERVIKKLERLAADVKVVSHYAMKGQ
jgi:mRNA-degrading endonuclease RelE of RelBE toxin-antitoxin system